MRQAVRLLAVAVVLLAGSGCTEHMVGPARTKDDYLRKARTTAEDARSAVETVVLVAEAADRGNTFGPYTAQSISEQEDRLAEIVGDFGSIQPPDSDADELRDELNEILDAAVEDLATVRIAARRGRLDGLTDVTAPLAADADELDHFLERYE